MYKTYSQAYHEELEENRALSSRIYELERENQELKEKLSKISQENEYLKRDREVYKKRSNPFENRSLTPTEQEIKAIFDKRIKDYRMDRKLSDYLDSMDRIDILLDIEREYNIEIDDAEAEKLSEYIIGELICSLAKMVENCSYY